jgi:hypothetical protein
MSLAELLAEYKARNEERLKNDRAFKSWDVFMAEFRERHPELQSEAKLQVNGLSVRQDVVKTPVSKPFVAQMAQERLDWAQRASGEDEWWKDRG